MKTDILLFILPTRQEINSAYKTFLCLLPGGSLSHEILNYLILFELGSTVMSIFFKFA